MLNRDEGGDEMAKTTTELRPWTATEVRKLKGLAQKRTGVKQIARALNRTVAATAVKASMLGLSLDTSN